MPKHDPYMRDRNIRDAASLQLLGGPALGAGLGFAASGWFGLSPSICPIVGAVVGFVLASVAISYYGGRSTR
jgi:hypothetical protein